MSRRTEGTKLGSNPGRRAQPRGGKDVARQDGSVVTAAAGTEARAQELDGGRRRLVAGKRRLRAAKWLATGHPGQLRWRIPSNPDEPFDLRGRPTSPSDAPPPGATGTEGGP